MTTAPAALRIDELRGSLQGHVITPDDGAYDEARRLFPGGLDPRPAAIARVANDDDVRRVVTHARETGTELAVRSGGHSGAGHSSVDGGIVLDLRDMTALEIDPDEGTAWAETGLTAGDYTSIAGDLGVVDRVRRHRLGRDRRHHARRRRSGSWSARTA